jgi:hypothetical protein
MNNVKRIYPESKTGLIQWVEENFHDIDEFVVMFQMKDDTTMFVYDTYSYRNAVGMIEMAKDTCHELSKNNEFIPKSK